MTFLRKRWGRLPLIALSVLALAALTAVACGDDDDDDDDGESPTSSGGEVDYGSFSGELNIDGSSTVFPIAEAMAEEFASAASDVATTVGFSGTGGGGEAFCRGEISIWNASRAARDTDLEDGCDDAGVASLDDLLEFQVGIDALTVVVNPANDWAQCMTVEQLQFAFSDGGASTWADIDPSWPDEKIIFYYPGTDSGTYDYFLEAIGLRGDEEDEPNHRSDGTPSEDDNVLALGVEQDEHALGYFGFAYFQEAGDTLRAVSVDNGEGCVEPTFDTALSGDYAPLSRPLYMYASDLTLTEAPQAAAFLHFTLSNAEAIVPEVGYVNVPQDTIDAALAVLEPYLQ